MHCALQSLLIEGHSLIGLIALAGHLPARTITSDRIALVHLSLGTQHASLNPAQWGANRLFIKQMDNF